MAWITPLPILAAILFLVVLPGAFCEDYFAPHLAEHNKYRALHQSPDVTISEELNVQAQKCAEYYLQKGNIDHSCPDKSTGKYPRLGENLYMHAGSELTAAQHATTAVDLWYQEIKFYNWEKPDLSKGTGGEMVGHFTQVVWKGSQEIGVGVAMKDKSAVVATLYGPPGNMQTLEKENVLPLTEGSGRAGSGNAVGPKPYWTLLLTSLSVVIMALVKHYY